MILWQMNYYKWTRKGGSYDALHFEAAGRRFNYEAHNAPE